MPAIRVLNPNASTRVTDAIDRAVSPLRGPEITITCHTSPDGPPGIESHADFQNAIPPLATLAGEFDPADGIIIACFSDPGAQILRAARPAPVLGIQEAAVAAATAQNARFGIIAIVEASVERQERALRERGQLDHWVGSRALDLSVAELGAYETALARMIEVGSALRDRDGADVVILGCAGMPDYRAPLEAALGLPVIEPCRVAVAQMMRQMGRVSA